MSTNIPEVRLYARISHFIVTRGDTPCVLLLSPTIAPKGILLPVVEGETPTLFLCNRENDRVPSFYGRRRALRAIDRTEEFAAKSIGSLIEELPVVQRLLQAPGGWGVITVKFPPESASIKVTQEEACMIAACLKHSARLIEKDASALGTAEDKGLYAAMDAFADKLLVPFADRQTIARINLHADTLTSCSPS